MRPETRLPWSPAGASATGMVLGWAIMCSLLLGVLGIGSLATGETEFGMLAMLGIYFAICSGVVCGGAWLLIALPVTWWCRRRLEAGEAWWHHGVRGGLCAFAIGLVPMLWGRDAIGGTLIFAGLAAVVGTVAGAWTGWAAQRAHLRGLELERTLTP